MEDQTILLAILLPVYGFASFAASALLVVRLRITHNVQALLVGMGAVPLVFGGITYIAYFLNDPTHSLMPVLAAIFGTSMAMIGGWIGASTAYLTNQKKSGQPELEQRYRDTLTKAERWPRRKTVNARLQKHGLQDTRNNIWLYLLGSFVVAISYAASMIKMIYLSFWDPHELAHLPLYLRLIGCIAPFAVPGLLWVLVRRWLPSLRAGLQDGVIPLAAVYLLFYVVENMIAAPPR